MSKDDAKMDLSLQPSGYQKVDGVARGILRKTANLGAGLSGQG